MNSPVPVEYVSRFMQVNQSLMLHRATEVLGEGGRSGDFQRFAERAQPQQDYFQQMGTLWLSAIAQTAAEVSNQRSATTGLLLSAHKHMQSSDKSSQETSPDRAPEVLDEKSIVALSPLS